MSTTTHANIQSICIDWWYIKSIMYSSSPLSMHYKIARPSNRRDHGAHRCMTTLVMNQMSRRYCTNKHSTTCLKGEYSFMDASTRLTAAFSIGCRKAMSTLQNGVCCYRVCIHNFLVAWYNKCACTFLLMFSMTNNPYLSYNGPILQI